MVERYYIDRLPQIDIACEMGLSRKTVNRRLQQAAPKIGRAAAQFNLPQ
jgi:DNA-directed RNA polymerase specialized sigma24 family protein